jgi:peptidoglycan/xylan/chitin deacetylase (PgdA/CDA1 family)
VTLSKQGLQAFLRNDVKRRLIGSGLGMSAMLAGAGMFGAARGLGAIFTLHHVRPFQPHAFQPNRHLEITPEFLDAALGQLSGDGYEFIDLAEVPARLASPAGRPFAVFTLDDGNRNNAEHALPVFAKHGAPFTVFITQGFAQRTHSLWWETLAALLRQEDRLSFDFGHGVEALDLRSLAKKLHCFERFAQFVKANEEQIAVEAIDRLARNHGLEPLAVTAELTMDPAELKILAEHPLASLGAHTVSHRAVGRLSAVEARREVAQSADYVEALVGERPSSVAYPYGYAGAVGTRDYALAAELGFTTGVTTEPGTLSARSGGSLTGLPRISLNGFYQRARYVSGLASGIPFLRR